MTNEVSINQVNETIMPNPIYYNPLSIITLSLFQAYRFYASWIIQQLLSSWGVGLEPSLQELPDAVLNEGFDPFGSQAGMQQTKQGASEQDKPETGLLHFSPRKMSIAKILEMPDRRRGQG